MRPSWMKPACCFSFFTLFLMNTALAQTFPATYWGAPYSLGSDRNTKYGTVGGPIHAFIQSLKPIPENNCFFRSVEVNPEEYSGEILEIIRDGEISSAGDCWRTGAIVASMYYFDPYKNLGSPCHCTSSFGFPLFGDPINAATGNKFEEDTDFIDPASWMTFKRYYNSDEAIASTAMGSHWRHSFDLSIDFAGLPQVIGSVTSLMLLRADGRRETFNKSSGQWSADPDVADRLVENVNPQGGTLSYSFYDAAEQRYETYNPDGLLIGITDQRSHSLTFTYSTALTSPSLAPRPGLLLSVVDSHGRQLQFTYNSKGLLAQVIQPDGGTLTYAYDDNSNLLAVVYPDTSSRQYKYNEATMTGGHDLPSALTGVIDEAGKRLNTTTYDVFGWATSSKLPGGANSIEIAYQHLWGPATRATIQFPLGQAVDVDFAMILGQYKVDAINKSCGTQCDQAWKSAVFDENGYPASTTDFKDQVFQTTYDSNGLLIQRIEAKGLSAQRTTKTHWNATLRTPLSRIVLDGDGMVTAHSSWNYNAIGQLTARCEADPRVAGAVDYACGNSANAPPGVRQQRTIYCEGVDTTQCPLIGLPLVVDGARTDVSDTTTFTYYLTDSATAKRGDLKTISDALGHTTTYLSYDGVGRVLSQQDANGVVTTYTYYPRGWLHTSTVGGTTTSITYTPYGAVASITDPDNVTMTYGYDDAHRLTDITDAQGNVIHYTLDATGNKTAEQIRTASGTVVHSLSRTYNPLGQLIKIVDGLNHTMFDATASESYDGNGNLVHSVDALGIQHQSNFDALNRLISTIDDYNGTDATTQNTTSALTYDAMDRLEGVADPDGLDTIYGYDGLGNRTSMESPDTGISADTYDAAGNRLTHTDAEGIVSTSSYDALNRLTDTHYIDSTLDVSYAYDEADAVTGCTNSSPIGRLTRAVESDVTTVLCYDSRGNVSEKRQVTAAQTDITQYIYSAAGRMIGIGMPDGTLVGYIRDINGRIGSVQVTADGVASLPTTVVTGIGYLPFGPISQYMMGSGQVVMRGYDANYALTDLASPALTLHFNRDPLGDIIAMSDNSVTTPVVETYNYDALRRLIDVKNDGATLEGYTYNRTGDRLSKSALGLATGAYYYASGTHRLAGIGNAAWASDASGNTITSVVGAETFGFGYNARHRLATVQRNGETVGTYTYNAFGQRIGKMTTYPRNVDVRFVYDEASHLIGEYGTTRRDYIWLDDLPVAVVDTDDVVVPPGPTVEPLQNDVAIRISGEAGSSALFSIQVPTGVSSFIMRTVGGSGNVGLYTKFGEPASATDYDHSANHAGNDEAVVMVKPEAGTYYLAIVAGSEAYTNVMVHARYKVAENFRASVMANAGATTATAGDTTIKYIIADHLGTPRVVTDAAGVAIWSWASQGNPFGEESPKSAMGYIFNLRYPGQYYDAETQTNYNVLRTYEPATGRYLQSDPIGLGGGLSTFSYVRSNPLLSIDLLGLDVAVVVDNNTVPIFGKFAGHAGVLVGNDSTGWDYYSKDGMVNGAQQDVHDTYVSLDNFFDIQGERYKTGEVFTTSSAQDLKMKQWADDHLTDEFNGFRNNCADFVYGVLGAGGLKVNPPTMSISIPNDMLDHGSGRIDWNQPHRSIVTPKYNPDMFKHGYW